MHCEAVFANPDLNKTYDVILIYADTYENPLRGSMTDAEWDGMFSFVKVRKSRISPGPFSLSAPNPAVLSNAYCKHLSSRTRQAVLWLLEPGR